MQVKQPHTDPTKTVDASKEAQKAKETKLDPNKLVDKNKPADAAAESERLAQSAKDFGKGLASHNQATQAIQDAHKVDELKDTVKAEAFRRDMEKSVKV